jgi:hypothetical protein
MKRMRRMNADRSERAAILIRLIRLGGFIYPPQSRAAPSPTIAPVRAFRVFPWLSVKAVGRLHSRNPAACLVPALWKKICQK